MWHVEFSIEGSGLSYEVGDALGVFPQNDPLVVEEILRRYGLTGDEVIERPDNSQGLVRTALTQDYEIRHLLLSQSSGSGIGALFPLLKPLRPRLYSISSSLKAHPGEVHLTVGAVRYHKDGFEHKGVCSTYLADRLPAMSTAQVYVQVSHGFRLPADPNTPIIMVGPGTGIAPFRAFLEEREAVGARGKNWLFFGDQHMATDFLYKDQLEGWVKSGHLTRLETAFSRDQSEKLYVQHRMLESAQEMWSWLADGAHFYVCGDASRMAKDVDATLHHIVAEQGRMSQEEAGAFVKKLKADHRYQRDVY